VNKIAGNNVHKVVINVLLVDVLVAAEVLTSSITLVLRVEYSGSKRTIKQMWNYPRREADPRRMIIKK
jgi:hypothetical protein